MFLIKIVFNVLFVGCFVCLFVLGSKDMTLLMKKSDS